MIKLLRWDQTQNHFYVCEYIRYSKIIAINLQLSFFLPHTMVVSRAKIRRVRAVADLGEVMLWVSLGARSHLSSSLLSLAVSLDTVSH